MMDETTIRAQLTPAMLLALSRLVQRADWAHLRTLADSDDEAWRMYQALQRLRAALPK